MSLVKSKTYWAKKYELEYRKEMLLVEYQYEPSEVRKESLKRIITSIDTVLIALEEDAVMRLRA